jgi:hypothetical protein
VNNLPFASRVVDLAQRMQITIALSYYAPSIAGAAKYGLMRKSMTDKTLMKSIVVKLMTARVGFDEECCE